MQEDKDAKIIMDLMESAPKALESVPVPHIQNTFVIHGGRQVFVQTTAPQRTAPKAKPPAKGRR